MRGWAQKGGPCLDLRRVAPREARHERVIVSLIRERSGSMGRRQRFGPEAPSEPNADGADSLGSSTPIQRASTSRTAPEAKACQRSVPCSGVLVRARLTP